MKRTKRTRVATVVVGLLFSVTLLVGLMFFAGFWTLSNTYTISAYVHNARGIAEDSTVFEAGLPVGLVTGVQRNGPDAILTLRIEHGPTPLPADSTIQLGLRSLAGEADVLLTLGHSRQLVRNGGSLGLSQDQSYTEVDQILNVLAGTTEGKARQFFQGIGTAVNGEGLNLNRTLGGFADLVNSSPPLTSTIGVQHQQVADIVQNLGNVMGAIGQRTQAVQQLARGALTTFSDVANRDAAFKRMLVELPYALVNTYHASHTIGVYGPTITPVVNNLADAALRLEPSIRLLQPASSSGLQLFDALGSASPGLKSVLVGLTQVEPSAVTALPALHSLTCQIDPMARFIQPYGEDIASFFENFGAAVEPYETNGAHELLGSLTVDPTNFLRGVTGSAPPQISSLLSTLFNYGIFRKAGGTSGYHGLTPPGHINDINYGEGDYGPAQWGATHTYPHVTADCAK